MVFLFISTLGISVVGMTGLLVFKRIELTTGRVVFERLRSRVGSVFHQGLQWTEQVLPELARGWIQHAIALCRRLAQEGIARGVLLLEQGLERILHLIRRTTEQPQRGSGEVSAFLREVADYKKKILRRTRPNNRSAVGQARPKQGLE